MEQIRRLKQGDLTHIHEIYKGAKESEYLNWLFENPSDPNELNGFVAENQLGVIVGVIGFAVNEYYIDDKKYLGAVPFSWKISPDYKGFAGIRLLQKVIALGDFGFALQGSDQAKKLYRTAGLKYVKDAGVWIKMLNPAGYLKYSKRSVSRKFLKIAYYLPSMINRKTSSHNKKGEISFSEITSDSSKTGYFTENRNPPKGFHIVEKYDRIKWKLSCPRVESYGFYVVKDNKQIGVVLLYIHKSNRSGRVVHITDFGENKELWSEIIYLIIDFFRSKKCTFLAVLANNRYLIQSMKEYGFIKHPVRYELFIKNPNGILSEEQITNWHLTYFESDRGTIRAEY